MALDYFRRLGHDNHRRLSKLYAWEEKKSKTSWGAQTVDYEKIAAAAVQAMTAADVNRFLIVCTLVSDLYCPGYNPRQPLEKDSNLARTAARYKVDSVRTVATVATVRAERTKREPKAKGRTSVANNLKTMGTAQRPKRLSLKRRKQIYTFTERCPRFCAPACLGLELFRSCRRLFAVSSLSRSYSLL